MGYAYIHFFNIEYWYCVIISLFGQHCTTTELQIAGGSGISTTTAGVAQVPTGAPVGFWEWLFGMGGNGAGAGAGGAAAEPTFFGALIGFFGAIFGFVWGIFSFVAFFASFLLVLAILGCLLGIMLIRMEDAARYGNLPPAAEKPHPLRMRWQELLQNAMSESPVKWREGIQGADEMLGELFARLGYDGANTAERIRKIPDGAFANLGAAWEAHRIKNFVFAPSSHFILTQREAFRVMKLYEQVFKEFDFI